jgi:hypothetical protein
LFEGHAGNTPSTLRFAQLGSIGDGLGIATILYEGSTDGTGRPSGIDCIRGDAVPSPQEAKQSSGTGQDAAESPRPGPRPVAGQG